MGPTYRVECTTEDYYTPADDENLKESFRDSLKDNDETHEVIEASTLSVVTDSSDSDNEVSDEQKTEIVQAFLAKATIQARLSISDDGLGFDTLLD